MTQAYEPKGIKFYDVKNRSYKLLVQDTDCQFDGWLCYRHPDGQWVTLRKATEEDITKIKEIQNGIKRIDK